MPSFSNIRRVPFQPQQMFDLVADVERYPEFVPMCERLVVRRRAQSDEGVTTLLADMHIGYRMIREQFTSRVMLNPMRMTIFVEYVDGPFSHLENRWQFRPDADGCAVHFAIDYAFKSRAFGLLAGAVFDAVFRRMVNAFEDRAHVIYGHPATGR
jgi:coenzyme Q-binding protein COQ10